MKHGEKISQQECITVGCVPSAAVAVRWWGVYLGGSLARGVSVQGGVCPEGSVHPQIDRHL